MNHSDIITDNLLETLIHIYAVCLINDDKVLTDTLRTISKETLHIIERGFSWIGVRYPIICQSIQVTDAISEVLEALE